MKGQDPISNGGGWGLRYEESSEKRSQREFRTLARLHVRVLLRLGWNIGERAPVIKGRWQERRGNGDRRGGQTQQPRPTDGRDENRGKRPRAVAVGMGEAREGTNSVEGPDHACGCRVPEGASALVSGCFPIGVNVRSIPGNALTRCTEYSYSCLQSWLIYFIFNISQMM